MRRSSSLQSFPFDKIKIDRTSSPASSQQQPVGGDRPRRDRPRKALDIPVIAEGVETEGERQFLQREGCEEMQGYLIGHPRPIENYASIIGGSAIPAAQVG